MNSIELRLLDLVRMAESPVYSSYRWLSHQLGRDLPLVEFFRLLDPLVENDVLRVWLVDSQTHERTRWRAIPPDMVQRYGEFEDLDDSYDPLGLSLTLGPAADPEVSPDWGVDFDFDVWRFVLTAKLPSVECAWRQIGRLFPDLDFVEDARCRVGDGIRITGSISPRASASDHA